MLLTVSGGQTKPHSKSRRFMVGPSISYPPTSLFTDQVRATGTLDMFRCKHLKACWSYRCFSPSHFEVKLERCKPQSSIFSPGIWKLSQTKPRCKHELLFKNPMGVDGGHLLDSVLGVLSFVRITCPLETRVFGLDTLVTAARPARGGRKVPQSR